MDPHRLGLLAVFLLVAEHLSFTAAAARLRLSKSAVSSKVSELEREVGLPLLVRTTRRVSLTDAGRRFADHARRSADEAEQAFDAVRQLRASPRGLLRVTAPVVIGRRLVGPVVPAYLAAHPEVSVELSLGDQLVDLAAEGFDLCVRHTDTPPDTHMAWTIRTVTWHLVAAPGYLERRGRPGSPADLAGHECLFYLRNEASTVWRLRRDGAVAEVRVGGRYRVNNSEVLCDAVLDGAGIGLLPDFTVASRIVQGDVEEVLPDWTAEGSFGSRIVASRHWTPTVPPLVRSFVAFLTEALGGVRQ
ncbi:LysR substrate-binding domain-containing protein [Arenibaculum sp.]|uniref:LysR substrate-binding domain-containing protein n=1 Tax=Arenibaculum sp. TaxID=2865862 RepID=UPI002E12C843|nr:LysR substrate-binding domain-containing protein [Arenibaculum sp.]